MKSLALLNWHALSSAHSEFSKPNQQAAIEYAAGGSEWDQASMGVVVVVVYSML